MFVTAHDADEEVTFYVDYRDGETRVTTDSTFSHAYAEVGTYSVNVTAQTRTTSETKFVEVREK